MISCYVYFLYSKKRQQFYVGISNDVADRLMRNNNDERLNTKRGAPCTLMHIITCADRYAAMQLEANIKRRGISLYLAENAIDAG